MNECVLINLICTERERERKGLKTWRKLLVPLLLLPGLIAELRQRKVKAGQGRTGQDRTGRAKHLKRTQTPRRAGGKVKEAEEQVEQVKHL